MADILEHEFFQEESQEDLDDEEILLFLLLMRRRQRRLRASHRISWTKRWILRRKQLGAYENLVRELNAEDPQKFRQYHRLDRQSFEDILQIISPYIYKQETRMRSSIKARERLAVTLRFLATGLYESLERYLYFACKFNYQLIELRTSFTKALCIFHLRRNTQKSVVPI